MRRTSKKRKKQHEFDSSSDDNSTNQFVPRYISNLRESVDYITPKATSNEIYLPRKSIAVKGNVQQNNKSTHSLLKCSTETRLITLNDLKTDNDDSDYAEENLIFPQWLKNYKRQSKYQVYSNIDLCSALFEFKSIKLKDFNKVFKAH